MAYTHSRGEGTIRKEISRSYGEASIDDRVHH